MDNENCYRSTEKSNSRHSGDISIWITLSSIQFIIQHSNHNLLWDVGATPNDGKYEQEQSDPGSVFYCHTIKLHDWEISHDSTVQTPLVSLPATSIDTRAETHTEGRSRGTAYRVSSMPPTCPPLSAVLWCLDTNTVMTHTQTSSTDQHNSGEDLLRPLRRGGEETTGRMDKSLQGNRHRHGSPPTLQNYREGGEEIYNDLQAATNWGFKKKMWKNLMWWKVIFIESKSTYIHIVKLIYVWMKAALERSKPVDSGSEGKV